MPPETPATLSIDDASPGARFTDLLASTIHDMKNSLGLVLDGLERLAAESPAAGRQTLQNLQLEAKKLSNQLVQLLSFYKMSHETLHAHCDEHDVAELLLESILLEKPLLEAAGIEADLRADDGLTWMLDRELVMGVLGNAINNAVRHARSRLLLSAETAPGPVLRLTVHDDGPGFPAKLLPHRRDVGQTLDFRGGHTGLGLSFCAMIADLHRRGEQRGRIELANGGALGGACFTLVLP